MRKYTIESAIYPIIMVIFRDIRSKKVGLRLKFPMDFGGCRKKLPGPYTQRICVDRYWSVTTLETQRINHSATIKFAFYAYKRHQSIIFSLNPAVKNIKPPRKPRSWIKLEAVERARQWKALIGKNGIECRADLARHLGISRARVTQVLRRLLLS